MTVYVDELLKHANARGIFRLGSCHLVADTLAELHAFAARIGMRRTWFQDHRFLPHYDLVASRRAAAVSLGAVEVKGMWLARKRREAFADGHVWPEGARP